MSPLESLSSFKPEGPSRVSLLTRSAPIRRIQSKQQQQQQQQQQEETEETETPDMQQQRAAQKETEDVQYPQKETDKETEKETRKETEGVYIKKKTDKDYMVQETVEETQRHPRRLKLLRLNSNPFDPKNHNLFVIEVSKRRHIKTQKETHRDTKGDT